MLVHMRTVSLAFEALQQGRCCYETKSAWDLLVTHLVLYHMSCICVAIHAVGVSEPEAGADMQQQSRRCRNTAEW